MSTHNRWPITTFDEVTSLITDGTHHSPPTLESGAYRYLTSKNIRQNYLDLSTAGYVDAAVHREIYKRCPVKKGDILLTKDGANTGLAAENTLDEEFSLLSSVALLRPKEGVLSSRYFVHWINSPMGQRMMIQNMSGSAIRRLILAEIKRKEIPLPPLSEQRRIADILDKADAIRRKRQEQLDALSALRSSVFLRLFGDPRTGRSDWPEVRLGEVTVLDAPMVDPREEEYIDLVHVGPDRIEKNTGRLLPALTAREEGLISGKFLFDDRYLLYSKIRPYLRKVALPHFEGLCSADVYPIRPVENMTTREYLFALLLSEAFLSYTTSLPSRASIPKLNRKELAAYTFNLPPIELQRRYTKILRGHEHTTATFGKAADHSEHLFNSLVQRAFKGVL